MSKKTNNQTAKVNWPITILLIIGCLTVFFPLYMAVIIAFKQPSEMTNPCYSDPFSGGVCDWKKYGK